MSPECFTLVRPIPVRRIRLHGRDHADRDVDFADGHSGRATGLPFAGPHLLACEFHAVLALLRGDGGPGRDTTQSRCKAGAKPVQSRCKPGRDRPCTGFGAGLDRLCLGRCANLIPHTRTASSETETGIIELFTVEVDVSRKLGFAHAPPSVRSNTLWELLVPKVCYIERRLSGCD